MNIMAVKTFRKLLLKQKRDYKKEIFVGILFLTIVIGVHFINQAVGTLLVITYLFVTSTANFVKNDIFWNVDDFASLNISVQSMQYFEFFLWQRILLDAFISNLIVGIGLSVFLSVRYGILQMLAFWLFIVLYYVMSPVCSVICGKKNKGVTAICVCVLLIIPVLLWLDFAFWHLATGLYSICTIEDFICCCLFSTVCFLFFTVVSKICKAQKNNNYPSRIILGFLKAFDIWFYKDYMLNYKMIFTNVISLAITLLLFVDADDIGILRPFLLWLVCGSKLFSIKDKKTKEYLLAFNDPLFCKKVEAQDIVFVRRKKFKAVISGGLIRLLVTLPFLVVLGFTSVEDIFIFGITSVISAMFECYTIYKSGMSTQAVIYLVNTTIPIVWGCVILKHYSMTFLYIYLTATILVGVFLLVDALRKSNIEEIVGVI